MWGALYMILRPPNKSRSENLICPIYGCVLYICIYIYMLTAVCMHNLLSGWSTAVTRLDLDLSSKNPKNNFENNKKQMYYKNASTFVIQKPNKLINKKKTHIIGII